MHIRELTITKLYGVFLNCTFELVYLTVDKQPKTRNPNLRLGKLVF